MGVRCWREVAFQAAAALTLPVLFLVAGAAPQAGATPTGVTGGTSTPAVPGTAGYAGSGSVAAANLAVPSASPADSSSDMSLLASQTVDGGYVSAGVGLRDLGFGTITVSGVPSGSTVAAAYLMWDVLDDSDEASLADGTFDGTSITGTPIGSGASPCWPTSSNYSFYADVTSLVSGDGNGSYSLSGFASGSTDGSDPWVAGSPAPEAEGASLVVVYQNASSPQTVFELYGGSTETDSGNALTVTLSGFTVGATASATTTYIVADGQGAGSEADFDGTALPGSEFLGAVPQAAPSYTYGNLWDDSTFDVSSYLSPGDTSETASVVGYSDCLVWVGQAFAVSGTGSAARQVVLVHGIGGNFEDVAAGVGGSLTANLDNLVIANGYQPVAFAYYQDQGYLDQTTGGCDPSMPGPDTNYSPLALNASGVGVVSQDYCDSQSAVALDATALRDVVSQLSSQQPGVPIAIVAHSMGAAVTRGYLALVQGGNGSLGNLDTVITIAGAQSGSWVPTITGPLVSNAIVAPLLEKLQQLAGSNVPFNTQRPAFSDLAAQSPWYYSVNNTLPPANLNYYNLYANVQVPLQFSINLFFWSHTWTVATLDSGDGLMLPGSDDPTATPALGGSKFLPYPDSPANNHEYEAVSSDSINLDGIALSAVAGLAATIASGGAAAAAAVEFVLEQLGGQVAGFVARYASNPVAHWNLQSHLGDGQVTVPSCTNPNVHQTPNQLVLSLLEDPSDACG